MSMEARELLPREITELLAGLRNNAHGMIDDQLESVRAESWGKRWQDRFTCLSKKPFAAASIEQVHETIWTVLPG